MRNKSTYESITTEFHVECCGLPEKKLVVTEGIENTTWRRWRHRCVPPIPTTSIQEPPLFHVLVHLASLCLPLRRMQSCQVGALKSNGC